MRPILTICFMLCFATLSGCAAHSYAAKYPDRPKALSTYQLLQTYVGKPVGAITPFLTPPKYKNALDTGTQLVWGNSGLATYPGGGLHSVKCELRIDVDNAGIITHIEYVDDYYSNQLRDCPQMGGINSQNYIIQPDLYEYDKAHGLLRDSYAVPKSKS